jgi:hypothetical protein
MMEIVEKDGKNDDVPNLKSLAGPTSIEVSPGQ